MPKTDIWQLLNSDVSMASVKALFTAHRTNDPMGFVVGSEVYDNLEKVVDRLEDVANRIVDIVIEHM